MAGHIRRSEKTLVYLQERVRSPLTAEELVMFRCLGYTMERKEVSVWPVWLCDMETVQKAVNFGWLSDKGRDVIIPRLGYTRFVYTITPSGTALFLEMLAKHNVKT